LRDSCVTSAVDHAQKCRPITGWVTLFAMLRRASCKSRSARTAKFVFAFNGERVVQLSTAAWYKALKRGGIENFRSHDLRHTWASWHIQSGTPLHVLQELGGWASYTMVQRYAHLAVAHLAPCADRLASSSELCGTDTAQSHEGNSTGPRQFTAQIRHNRRKKNALQSVWPCNWHQTGTDGNEGEGSDGLD